MVKKVLSIEIGLLKTRICEVSYQKKNAHIYKCITFDTPKNTVEDGFIRDNIEFAAVLKEKLIEAKMQITNVIFTISSTKIANREVIIPMVKENKIQAVVDASVNDYFPVDVSEYIISYSILERIKEKEDKKIKLLVLAVPDLLIKSYHSLAKLMNFTILALDYVGNSAYQILKRQVGQGTSLLVQINEQSTLINVIVNDTLGLQRTIPYGTMALINTIIENKYLKAYTETEAVKLLTEVELINKQFHFEMNEEAASLAETSVHSNHARIVRNIKEEVTDTLQYIVINVIRILDYYNAKFPENKIDNIYITGQGSRFKGIKQLFQNETGYDIKQIDQLSGAIYSGNPEMQENLTDYLCTIGAAIHPIGFISKDIIAKDEKKSSWFNMSIIFILSVFLSLLIVITSYIKLNVAKHEKNELDAKITSLLPAQDIYNELNVAESEYKKYNDIYFLTKNQNEHLNKVFHTLEDSLPSSAVITSLTISNKDISINITTNTKLAAAILLVKLRNISLLQNITVDSIAESQDENGLTTVTLAVNCQYKENNKEQTSVQK